jgi:hypothetical protein
MRQATVYGQQRSSIASRIDMTILSIELSQRDGKAGETATLMK